MHGAGTVFELTPTQSGEWDFKTLYSFRGETDGVFLTALCFLTGAVMSTARLTTAEQMMWVRFIGCRPTALGSGMKECSTASGREVTETVPSATSCLTRAETSTAQPAKADWAAARSSSWLGNLDREYTHSFQGPPDGAFPYAGMFFCGRRHLFRRDGARGDDGEGAIYHFYAITGAPTPIATCRSMSLRRGALPRSLSRMGNCAKP